MTRWGAIVSLALASSGCGPPVDPLAALRDTYAEAASQPATELAPHATFKVDDRALSRLVTDLVDRPVTAPGPFGMRLVVLPAVEQCTLTARGSAPMTLSADLSGEADIAFPLMSADGLRFEGRLAGPLQTEVRTTAQGTWIGVRWHNTEAIQVTVLLPDATAQMSALAEGMVAGALKAALSESRGLTLPPNPWGTIRDVRLSGENDDLVAHLVLSGTTGAPPPERPPPDDGWSATASAETVLGIAQAIALVQPVAAKLVVEPLEVTLDEGIATIRLRVHERSRKEKWREYTLTSPVVWDQRSLRLPVETLERVDQRRWRGGLRVRIGEDKALRLLQEGLADVPAQLVVPLGGSRAMRWSLTDVVLVPDALELQGTVTAAKGENTP